MNVKKFPTTLPWLLSALILLTLNSMTQAADEDPLFQDSQTLDITLSGPFSTINRQRDKDRDYDSGTLSYMDNGQEVTLSVNYEVRGNFRLRKDVCSFAQVWVNLKRSELEGTLFANQNRLKLVVQCKNSTRYKNYLIKEHQAYQINNTITDLSYRTRLLNVTYHDTDRDRTRQSFGFFIEHKNRLANRVGMETVDLNRIDRTELDPLQSTLASLFMFMAGNTDFSFISAPQDECCHNAKLLQPAGEARYFPTPYDFDSTGYVDAGYAEPNPRLRLRNVRQRLYRGFCVPEAVFETALDQFRSSEEQILAIAGDTSFVDNKTADKSLEYIQDFYAIINDPEELQSEIVDDCRG